jgi:subfamily B ATP-binding cassette protein MsbA
MDLYLRILKFIRPYWVIFFVAIAAMVVSTIFDGVSLGMIVPVADNILSGKKIILPRHMPPFLDKFVDGLNNTSALVLLKNTAIFIIILFTLKGIATFIQGFLMNDVSQRLVRDIRNALYEKLQTLSLDYYHRAKTGVLISRITYDVVMIQTAISEALADLLYYSLQLILFTFIVFFIHARLALVALVLLPLIGLPAVRIGRLLRKISRRAQEKMADINSTLHESISGVRIVKAFSMENYEINKFRQHNQDFYRLMLDSVKKQLALGPITEFFGACAGAFVLFLGGREVIRGVISFGVFILFLGALLSLLKPFKRLGKVYTINQQALAAVKRVFEVLDSRASVTERETPHLLKNFETEIIFDRVSFKYEERLTLKEISLSIKKGEIVAIVGPTGSGKTTLVNLIPRFYDVTQGRILIDGIDVRDLSIKSLREKIGMVTQETILFNDTVRMNIAYGRPQADFSEIVSAAKIANAHDFIGHLAHGYDTVIGEHGVKLSGGERQRLAIARAILKNPPLLVLDEATSQLDSASEKIVQQALERLMQNRTVLLIAHRLSTIRNATKIVVLKDGEITGTGNHEELMQQNPLYRKLYEMQYSRIEA